LEAQAGHPAEDVGIAAQLIGITHFGMSGSEPGEELANGPAVVTVGARTERDSEGVDGAAEGGGVSGQPKRPIRRPVKHTRRLIAPLTNHLRVHRVWREVNFSSHAIARRSMKTRAKKPGSSSQRQCLFGE